jgi:hypothetical protein
VHDRNPHREKVEHGVVLPRHGVGQGHDEDQQHHQARNDERYQETGEADWRFFVDRCAGSQDEAGRCLGARLVARELRPVCHGTRTE